MIPANDQISYPKITIADFDLDIPHSLPSLPTQAANSPKAISSPSSGSQSSGAA